LKIAVLMGGVSAERHVSLASGLGVLNALHERGHEVVAIDAATSRELEPGEIDAQILPSESGESGPQAYDIQKFSGFASRASLEGIDVVFVALHGTYGEDGTLQAVLDLAGIPYTGSGMLASALAMNKHVAKRIFRDEGIPTPRWRIVPRGGAIPSVKEIARELGGFPVVVKPNDQGSTVGFTLAAAGGALPGAFEKARKHSAEVLFEEYIPGRELTVAVLDGKALPVVEVFAPGGLYDFEAKYVKGKSRYQVPADISAELESELKSYGERAYRVLGCSGVARVDFRVKPGGAIYCLEVNTIPGFTETSLVPMAAGAAGMGYGELVERLCLSALKGKRSGSWRLEKRC